MDTEEENKKEWTENDNEVNKKKWIEKIKKKGIPRKLRWKKRMSWKKNYIEKNSL